MTYAHHDLDIYGTHLYATATKRGWANIRRRVTSLGDLDTRSSGMTEEALFVPKGNGPARQHIAVYINPNDSEPERIDTIAHEATHVAQRIFEARGADTSGEPFAYLIGWTTRWLYENLPHA